jgi:tetratricopeptide (TPR) repeat protein
LQQQQISRELAEVATSLNPPVAAKLFSALAVVTPDAAWPWLGQAGALRQAGEIQAATQALGEAERIAPDSVGVLIQRALVATHGCMVQPPASCIEAWRAAVINLRAALAREPQQFDAIYRLGLAHLYLGQPGEALGYLTIALRRAPWSPRVNYFLGEAYRQLGDTRAGIHLSNASRWASSSFYRYAADRALAQLSAPE